MITAASLQLHHPTWLKSSRNSTSSSILLAFELTRVPHNLEGLLEVTLNTFLRSQELESMWPPKNWPLEPLVLDVPLNPTFSSPSPQASFEVRKCTDLITAPKPFYSYVTLLTMGGPNRKRTAHEKTTSGSSGDRSSTGKESSAKRSDTRSAPQSLPRYDGNRDSGSPTTPVGAITTANLRRLEMSFGMWASYRGVSDLSVLVLDFLL